MKTEATERGLVYLYCVTGEAPKRKDGVRLSDKPDRQTRAFGQGVYCVSHQDLYAVVSNVEESEFGEENFRKNLADLEWIKTRAATHENVIEDVMKHTHVIPFKFGTIFNGESGLKAMLDGHADSLKVNLKRLKGKEEWGLKIYCNMEKLIDVIPREEAEITKIEKEINLSSPGKAFFLKKKRDEMVRNAADKRINQYGQESFELLRGLSVESRINRLLPKEVTEREDTMVLNAAFLVAGDKVAEFVQAADDLKAKYRGRGFDFNCTGPWPPYNFCAPAEEKS